MNSAPNEFALKFMQVLPALFDAEERRVHNWMRANVITVNDERMYCAALAASAAHLLRSLTCRPKPDDPDMDEQWLPQFAEGATPSDPEVQAVQMIFTHLNNDPAAFAGMLDALVASPKPYQGAVIGYLMFYVTDFHQARQERPQALEDEHRCTFESNGMRCDLPREHSGSHKAWSWGGMESE